MKKSIYVMATALMTFASCSNEDLLNEVNIQNDVIKASFEQGVTASRLAISDGEVLTWSTGDAFMLFGEGSSAKFTLSEGAGQATATFTGTAPSTITGAAFPWESESKPSLSNGTLTMTLPATLDQTTAGACNLPMWASTTSVDEISFKHLAGVLKVNFTDIPTGYNQLVVTASNPISGEFTATTTDDEPVLSSTSTADEDKTVTVNFTAATDNANDAVLYIPLPVGTYTSIVVSVSDGTTTKELITYNNKTVERAKVYTIALDYSEIEATVATQISTIAGLKEAFANGGEYKLTTSLEVAQQLSLNDADKTLTIDLNGNTLTMGTTSYGIVNKAGTLVIKNGTISSTNTYAAITNYAGTSAISTELDNVTLTASNIAVFSKGVWEDNKTIQDYKNSDAAVKFTINGGSITSTTSATDYNYYTVYGIDYSLITIKDATITGSSSAGGLGLNCAEATLTNVTINGGTTGTAHDVWVRSGLLTTTGTTYDNYLYSASGDYGYTEVNGKYYGSEANKAYDNLNTVKNASSDSNDE